MRCGDVGCREDVAATAAVRKAAAMAVATARVVKVEEAMAAAIGVRVKAAEARVVETVEVERVEMWDVERSGTDLAAAQGDVVVELELLRERLVELEARAVEDVRRQDALRLLLQLLQPRRAAPVLPLALPRRNARRALSAEAGGAEGGRELITSGQLRTNTDSRKPVIGFSELLRTRVRRWLSSVHDVWRRVITGHG